MTEMHLQNNELNDRKYQSYVKSEKAERPGTIRQKKKKSKTTTANMVWRKNKN